MAIATHNGKTVHMTNVTTKEAPVSETKKTRGNGPIKVRFLSIVDGAEVISDKATNVHSVVIERRDGDNVVASNRYPLAALNEEVQNSFAALGYARVLETYMRNHAKPDGSDAIDLATKRNGEIVEGKLYVRAARGEGSSKGADVTVYVDAFKIAMQIRKVAVTPDQIEAFKNKLEATKGKDRLAAIAKLNKDVIYKRALLEAKLNIQKAASKIGGKQKEDLVNYLDLI